MIYHIDVTQEDINKGCRENEFACPIALAIRRVTGMGTEVGVTPSSVHLYYPENLVVRAPLPEEASAFIRTFDSGEAVEPFSFDLDTSPDIST